jgi:hypothetical protein
MYHAVVEFLQGFVNSTTATNLFPALAAKFATLITRVGNVVALAAQQEQPLEGKLRDREQALDAAVETTVIVAGAVLSYARTCRLHDLAVQVRRTRTEFRRRRRTERTSIAQRVHDVAAPLAVELVDYGLTAGMLEELQETIDATAQAVTAPVSARAEKKVSTRQLARAFTEVEQLLAQIDPMLLKLGKIDPTMHALYLAARKVFKRTGARAAAARPGSVADPAAPAAEPAPEGAA